MVEIRVQAHAAAPLAVTWSVLADQVGMTAWSPARTVTLEEVGEPPPDGIGAIRVLSRGPLKIREQVIAVDKPNRLSYRMLSGLPIRDYLGETNLTGGHMATDIVWTVTVTPRFPGMTTAIRLVVRRLAYGLAEQAERVAQAKKRSG